MKKLICAIIFTFLPVVCFADVNDTPTTKIESVLLKSGVIYQKQWIDLGDVDNVVFKAIILRDQNSLVTAKGLNIEVSGYNGSSSSSWLDINEVNDLLKALDYMLNTARAWDGKPLKDYTEVVFSTKDRFKIGFYGKSASSVKINDLKVFVSSGYVQKASRSMDIEHLEELKQLIKKSLAALQ